MSNYNTDYFNHACDKANDSLRVEHRILLMLSSIAKSLSAIADIMEEQNGVEYEEDDDEDSDD